MLHQAHDSAQEQETQFISLHITKFLKEIWTRLWTQVCSLVDHSNGFWMVSAQSLAWLGHLNDDSYDFLANINLRIIYYRLMVQYIKQFITYLDGNGSNQIQYCTVELSVASMDEILIQINFDAVIHVIQWELQRELQLQMRLRLQLLMFELELHLQCISIRLQHHLIVNYLVYLEDYRYSFPIVNMYLIMLVLIQSNMKLLIFQKKRNNEKKKYGSYLMWCLKESGLIGFWSYSLWHKENT